jgi:hypothetical protein
LYHDEECVQLDDLSVADVADEGVGDPDVGDAEILAQDLEVERPTAYGDLELGHAVMAVTVPLVRGEAVGGVEALSPELDGAEGQTGAIGASAADAAFVLNLPGKLHSASVDLDTPEARASDDG